MADQARAAHPTRMFWHPGYAIGRLLWCVAAGVAVMLPIPHRFAWRVRSVAGWDVCVLLLLSIDWWRILRATPQITARRAASEDVGRFFVWIITMGAGLFSLFSAVIVLKRSQAFPPLEQEVWSILALLGVLLAWGLTHTAYALRYAHLHYGSAHIGGFDFKGDDPPAEVDFAYLAFTIGMTFAVSDVNVTCTRTRRAVLFHSVVAFIYNMTILALAIQLAFDWLG